MRRISPQQALWTAIERAQPDMLHRVREALHAGADINQATPLRLSPLGQACAINTPAGDQLVQYLLDRGANPLFLGARGIRFDEKDSSASDTPLIYALCWSAPLEGRPSIPICMLKACNKFNHRDDQGNTADLYLPAGFTRMIDPAHMIPVVQAMETWGMDPYGLKDPSKSLLYRLWDAAVYHAFDHRDGKFSRLHPVLLDLTERWIGMGGRLDSPSPEGGLLLHLWADATGHGLEVVSPAQFDRLRALEQQVQLQVETKDPLFSSSSPRPARL